MPLFQSESKCETILILKNDFDLHENETVCRTHFHMKGFALRLVLNQGHKRTRKWPISRRLVSQISKRRRSVENRRVDWKSIKARSGVVCGICSQLEQKLMRKSREKIENMHP